MYEHADQTWREMPRFLSREVGDRLAERIAEYAEAADLGEVAVVFHGGEPLLAGPAGLVRLARGVREKVRHETAVSFSLQTNGTLLTASALAELRAADIGVSLSFDGPSAVNDLHRLTPGGGSSFDAVLKALRLLERHQEQFAGVIAVVDPRVPAEEILTFFSGFDIPQLDFLLPDANYQRLPPGRSEEPNRYRDWLINAFDCWFDRFSNMPVRTFDQLLRSVAGLPSQTDGFGLGDVSLLTVETDGSYHDLDVLKITEHGATALGVTVFDTTIKEVAASSGIEAHRKRLRKEGLSATCRACSEVDTCGGGAVPHRYGEDGTFEHPSVYCFEMLELLSHARARLTEQVQIEGECTIEDQLYPAGFSSSGSPQVADSLRRWRSSAVEELATLLDWAPNDGPGALGQPASARLATHPTVALRARIAADDARGVRTRSLDGRQISVDSGFAVDLRQRATELSDASWGVHRDDPWLRKPFGLPILFESDGELIEAAREQVRRAETVIGEYSPELLQEMHMLTREIQFIQDLDADPDKCVSFSDDVVPGALYVSIRGSTSVGEVNGVIDFIDLADSLIHEHRHQKLYLLQRTHSLLKRDYPLLRSPWRQDPRPPSGLLHALFVFVELQRFWSHVSATQPKRRSTADSQVDLIGERLKAGWQSLSSAPLTEAGKLLVSELRASELT